MLRVASFSSNNTPNHWVRVCVYDFHRNSLVSPLSKIRHSTNNSQYWKTKRCLAEDVRVVHHAAREPSIIEWGSKRTRCSGGGGPYTTHTPMHSWFLLNPYHSPYHHYDWDRIYTPKGSIGSPLLGYNCILLPVRCVLHYRFIYFRHSFNSHAEGGCWVTQQDDLRS
jgi:hypothetical protein